MPFRILTNAVGKQVVRISKAHKPDRKRRIPAWNVSERCWQVLSLKYLRRLTEEEREAHGVAQRGPA